MAGIASLWALAGNWTLSREISHEDGRVDRLEGACTFKRSGPRLIQDEQGTLVTADGQFEATRRYIWREEGGRLDVFFADMRPFHSIPQNIDRPETTYLCPPDRYQVSYDFSQWPEWKSVWRVEGPRKDYTMTNVYSPAAR